jgi:ribosomal protein L11 methyltransferase
VRPDYWALDVSLGPGAIEVAEAVTNFVWEAGAIGVVEEAGEETTGLRAFFPPDADPAGLKALLSGYLDELRALSIAVEPGTVEAARLPEEPWAEAWRAHFRPLAVGRRLVVCPPWERPASDTAPDRLVVVIEPGRAFGTGGHATTESCLELLERAFAGRPPARILDVGTGSGVLAIAAARLGGRDIRALDLDPDAVAAARANARRNRVADRVRVELASIETWTGPPAELVLANLLGPTHVALARVLACCCAVPGRLIAGGLLLQEVPAVLSAYAPEGFALETAVEREEWATVLLARPR